MWWFLPYIHMNQLWVYMCSPSRPSFPPPAPSHLWVIPVHQPWPLCLMHGTWTGNLFHIWWYTRFNALLSNHPTLVFSHRVQQSVLYICVSFSVSHIGSLLRSFYVPYICVNILYWCFSFWLTLLCIIGSSFIHLIRTAESGSLLRLLNGF